MKNSPRRRAIAGRLALLLVLVVSPGRGQSKEPRPPLSVTLQGPARDAYEAGRALFVDGDAAGALVKFRLSHELSRDPRLLWNMAVCEKTLRHYHRTHALLERYLVEGGASIPDDERAQVQETLRAIRGFVSEVRLTIKPAGATVLVDGENSGQSPLPGPLMVDLGRRTIRIEKPGHTPWQRVVEVAGGAELALEATLEEEHHAGRLVIQAPGGAIRVDGVERGQESWSGQLEAGTHAVRVTAPGRRAYAASVDLTAGATRTLDVTLEALPAASGAWWPWLVGAGAVVVGAGVGGYFLLRADPAPASRPSGTLAPGQVRLPLRGLTFAWP